MRRIDRRKIFEGLVEFVMDLKVSGEFNEDWVTPRENEMLTCLYFRKSIESISEDFGLSLEYTKIVIGKACRKVLKRYYLGMF